MGQLPLRECNLFFFDCETGGLNAYTADMVEVAVILTDPTGKDVIETYTAKVFPKKPVDARAAAINGYTEEKWAVEAIELDDAMYKMVGMAKNAAFVAHNAPFDWSFFEIALVMRGMRWPGDYHKFDTVSLATPFFREGETENLKLTTLTAHYGVPHDNAHTAMSDAAACRGVYLKLQEEWQKYFAWRATERVQLEATPVPS